MAKTQLEDPLQFLEVAMMAAHIEIHRHRAGRGLPESPRTTCVAAVFQNNTAWWAHAGDSRLYWIRDGNILEVTRDHSQLEAMMADRLLSQNRPVEDLPNRNQLFNCLGAPAMPLIELADPVAIQPGDCFLLCSDGVWAPLSNNLIAAAFKDSEVSDAVSYLIHQALSRAGASSDNVSALAMSWNNSSDSGAISGLVAPTMQRDHKFAATIRTQSPDEADPISEQAIESAIAEIRQAIARTEKDRR
jgi:protein phosphatase